LNARRNQLNYRGALANGLPIGSGEIESAHRYIAQQCLKRPGAWWRVDHAEYMLPLRITRRNGVGCLFGHVRQRRLARGKSERQPYRENPQRDCITLDRTPMRNLNLIIPSKKAIGTWFR
jgi:hypothetical protein